MKLYGQTTDSPVVNGIVCDGGGETRGIRRLAGTGWEIRTGGDSIVFVFTILR